MRRWLMILLVLLAVAHPAVAVDGCLLQEDASSYLLQEDGSSRLVLEDATACAGGGGGPTSFFERRRIP